MGVREENKERNRRLILEAATRVFAASGYHNATISDILRQTDLSRGTFYLYFENKAEIFKTMMDELFRLFVKDFQLIRRKIREDGTSPEHALRFGLESLFKSISSHKEIFKIILNSPAGLDEEFDAIINRYTRILTDSTTSIVTQALLKNNRVPPSPRMAGMLIYAGVREVVDRVIIKGEMDVSAAEAIDYLVQYNIGALYAFEEAAD